MMREKITKSLQGRILLISMIGLVACILSLYMVSSITIQSVEQHRLENSLMANMSNEIDHLEFCYFTMVRMMQQMGEDGSIGSMLEDYLYSENNFEKYQRRRELENEIVSIGFINNYVNLAIYIDSDTKEELFDSVAFKDKDFAAGCVMQIGENQFQALHKSKRKSSEIVVVSLLEERQAFDGRTLDIYIEMKSNIEDYAPRGALPIFPCSWMKTERCSFPTATCSPGNRSWIWRWMRTAAFRESSGTTILWQSGRIWDSSM